MWRQVTFRNDRGEGEAHVYPVVDVRKHDESPLCWCCPRSEPTETGLMWIHDQSVPSYATRATVGRA